MKLKHKIGTAKAVLEALILRKRAPLLVSWEITRHCNARCKYCTIWDNPPAELDTAGVFSIIQDLALMGTRIIHFTGGEALLRGDFGEVLRYCRQKDIMTSLNSNGALVPARIEELTTLRMLGISIDGPEEVHDSARGQGSFRKAIDALRVATGAGIQTRLLAVLSKQNLDAVDFLLEKAREFDSPVLFQPATELLLGGHQRNPIAPDIGRYRRTIRELIAKKNGRESRYIVNSPSGLKFLYEWPTMRKILCLVHLVSCRIDSDGSISICFRNLAQESGSNDRISVRDAFGRLHSMYCNCCCCAPGVELNCLLSLKFDTIVNTYRYLRVAGFLSGRGRAIRHD